MKPINTAVFLDRDGTVIHDCGYLKDAGDVELVPGAAEALRELRREGFLLVLVTNQSGIGRGYFDRRAVDRQHEKLHVLLREHGVSLDALSICPHAPDEECSCRKPSPEMLHNTARQLGIDLKCSYMVGDKPSDVGAGLAAGCKAVLVGPRNDDRADHQAGDLAEAVKWILEDSRKPDG